MEGLLLGGLFFGAIAVMLPLVLILALIVIVALRGDPDDGGRRAEVLYLAGASAAAIVTIVVAVTALTASIAELPGNNDERSEPSGWINYAPNSGLAYEDEVMYPEDRIGIDHMEATERGSRDDGAVRGIVASVIAALVAWAVLRFHWPRLEAVRQHRVHTAYCYVLCFAAVLTLLVTVSVAIYAVAELVAPDTMAAGDRGDVVEKVVPVLVLISAATRVFRVHWRRVESTPDTA